MGKVSIPLLSLKEKTEALIAGQPKEAHFKWPKELKDEILRSIQEGVKTPKVAQVTGISYQTIRSWVARSRKQGKRYIGTIIDMNNVPMAR